MDNILEYYKNLPKKDKDYFFETIILDAINTGRMSLLLFTKRELEEITIIDMSSFEFKKIQENALERAFSIFNIHKNM